MKVLFSIAFLAVFMVPVSLDQIDNKAKILVERVADQKLKITNVDSLALSELEDESDLFVTITLNYDVDEDVGIDGEKSEASIARTRSFFYNNNMDFIEENNITADEIFVSEYTPFIFCKYENDSVSSIYTKATQIANSIDVSSIYISDESAYAFESNSFTDMNMMEPMSAVVPTKFSRTAQDNYPSTQLALTGYGVSVGILDKGILDVDSFIVKGCDDLTVTDNVASNNSNTDPTKMAAIISASNSIAPNASVHFVDVENKSGLTAIEDLATTDIILIGVAHINPVMGDSYSSSTDLYIDYFYQTTKVIMVAGAGDTNEYEDMGFIPCPSSASNVITVGSIDYSGVPSKFSNYRSYDSVSEDDFDWDKPHISAVGYKRRHPGFTSDYCTGTKFSAAAVAGTLALLKEKHGANLDYTSAVMILQISADYTLVDLTDQTIALYSHDVNDANGNGNTTEYLLLGETMTVSNSKKGFSNLRKRTGAGVLDIQRAVQNLEVPITSANRSFGTNVRYTLPQTYNLNTGDMIEIAFAAQKYVIKDTFWPFTVTVYHAYFDFYMEIWSNNTRVGYYTSLSNTSNMGRHIAMQPGTFSVVFEVEPMALNNMHNFNYGVFITYA